MDACWIGGLRRWRAWMALGTAYLLVLQLLIAGFAGAAQASPDHRDAFGTIVCSSAGGETPAKLDGPAPDHSDGHTPACCTLGCAMASPGGAPPPDIAAVLPPPPAAGSVVFARAETGCARAFGRTPQNARAPPGSV